MKILITYILAIFAICAGCATPKPAEVLEIKPEPDKTASPVMEAVAKPSVPLPVTPDNTGTATFVDTVYLDRNGKLAGRGDPGKPVSEAIKAGMGVHPQALQDARLPKDKYGLIDWAKLVKEKIINPRESLETSEVEEPLDLDVVIDAKSGFVNDVVFPHWIHTYWVKCDVCHDKIFVPARGENKMSMAGIAQGKWCGKCHSKTAFPLTDCVRCHVKVKEKVG